MSEPFGNGEMAPYGEHDGPFLETRLQLYHVTRIRAGSEKYPRGSEKKPGEPALPQRNPCGKAVATSQALV